MATSKSSTTAAKKTTGIPTPADVQEAFVKPLKGMAEYLADARSPRRAVLVYSNRSQDEIAYHAELDALARANPNFRVVHTLTREPAASAWAGRRGRIDQALLSEAARGLDEPTYYVCGVPDMVRDAAQGLLDAGVPRARIAYELFPGYARA